MFLKAQFTWNVAIPAETLSVEEQALQKAIFIRLLHDFATKKATKDHGYFRAVTTLDKIGKGKVMRNTGELLFPVDFNAITFKVFKGEIIEGIVNKVLKLEVVLKCGPFENVFLSSQKMQDYKYIAGENLFFLSNKSSKIEKDEVVRCVVLGTKWAEADREFSMLVSMDGDRLGLVA
ncbi:hypothetical protein FEM48_ZijujUnG0102100 [Ziziphus jujuba var. spinosa]|uniref:DNA-directed RNA polymerase subunit n=1 Tax=Ziziphus jujuba var. spinosa TaxID=714518 RepID=A0A978U888_ZIZJJ|nr:DNA-directed RNA polymerase V subunit 7-like [Ziziphus jujuba var. spinosa]KAH7510664.1 hypothetical protein FEM48_ZijujUnG0102100 [Ziziphus jujuba var. spinosa]